MYQQLTIIGNLGNDPEMRYTPNGVPVASFSVAASKKWQRDDQEHEKTIWFRVTAWRKLAEIASQYLAKGQRVLVIGEIEEVRVYTNRAGEPTASLEVTAQTIKFLSPTKEGVAGPATSGPVAHEPALTEEDIPF